MMTKLNLFMTIKYDSVDIIDILNTYDRYICHYIMYNNSVSDNLSDLVEYFEGKNVSYFISKSMDDILEHTKGLSNYTLCVGQYDKLNGCINLRNNCKLTHDVYLSQYINHTNTKIHNIPNILSPTVVYKYISNSLPYYADAILFDNNYFISSTHNECDSNNDYFKGEFYLQNKNYDLAEELFDKLLKGSDNTKIKYACLLGLVQIKQYKINNIVDVEPNYLQLYNIDNTRIEPLFILARYYSKNGNFSKAYHYASMIKDKVVLPTGEAYGLIKAFYDYEYLDETAVISYYMKEYKDAIIMSKKLIKSNISDNYKARIRGNMKFSIDKIKKDIIYVYSKHKLGDNILVYLEDLADIYDMYIFSDYEYDVNFNYIQFEEKHITKAIQYNNFYALLLIDEYELPIPDNIFSILLINSVPKIIVNNMIDIRLSTELINIYAKNVSQVITTLNPTINSYYLLKCGNLLDSNSKDIIAEYKAGIIPLDNYTKYLEVLTNDNVFVKDLLLESLIYSKNIIGECPKLSEMLGDYSLKCNKYSEALIYYNNVKSYNNNFNMKVAKCIALDKKRYMDIYDYLNDSMSDDQLKDILDILPNNPRKDMVNIYVLSKYPNKWVSFVNSHNVDYVNFIRVNIPNVDHSNRNILSKFKGNDFSYRNDIINYRLANERIMDMYDSDSNLCVLYEDVIITDMDKLVDIINSSDTKFIQLSENIIHGYVLSPSLISKFSFDMEVNIKNIINILTVHGDPYDDMELKQYDGYKFYSGLDSPGYDIKYVGNLPVDNLKDLADSDNNCVGFNTLGWLKYNIQNSLIKLSDDPNMGLYIKDASEIIRSKMNNIINKKNGVSNLTFTITTCKRLDYFIRTMDQLLYYCKDIELVDEWLCIDDNSSETDRNIMRERYPFFKFIMKGIEDKGHARSMNLLLDNVKTDFVMHFEDDWLCSESFCIEDILQLMEDGSYGQIILRKICWGDHDFVKYIDNRKLYEYVYNPLHFKKPLLNIEYDRNFDVIDTDYDESMYWWWPGFTLNPSIFNISTFRSIGKFNEDIRQELFEYDFARRGYDRGIKIAYINFNIEHIGEISSYSLNNMKRYYDK